MSVRSKKEERARERAPRKTWIKVTDADLTALDDYISDTVSLGC